MNWLDILLLAILVVGAILGMRLGLLGAAINAMALLIGWLVAGRLSDEVGGIFASSLSSDTIVTVLAYIVIMALSLVLARIVWKVVRPIVNLATLGVVGVADRVGGIVVGAILGIMIASAIIIVLARFTYNFELPDTGITGGIAVQVPKVEDTKEAVEGALTDSATVPAFINFTNALPGNALGFIPSDFKISLEILESAIEG
ncbi:MAG: CvpA family protein [Chloroflexi bacterium]|nr:CvpA family protein [Chloroflexota bacterium]